MYRAQTTQNMSTHPPERGHQRAHLGKQVYLLLCALCFLYACPTLYLCSQKQRNFLDMPNLRNMHTPTQAHTHARTHAHTVLEKEVAGPLLWPRGIAAIIEATCSRLLFYWTCTVHAHTHAGKYSQRAYTYMCVTSLHTYRHMHARKHSIFILSDHSSAFISS